MKERIRKQAKGEWMPRSARKVVALTARPKRAPKLADVAADFVRPTPKWEPRLYARAGAPEVEGRKVRKPSVAVDGKFAAKDCKKTGDDDRSVIGDKMKVDEVIVEKKVRDAGCDRAGRKRLKFCWAFKARKLLDEPMSLSPCCERPTG